jgi:predicted O-methyltransferase YrrM
MIIPPLVERALGFAAQSGFESSCRPEEGALLHVLAARRGIARAAEIGTGAGVGAAWIVSALPPETPFFSAEVVPELAGAVATVFVEDPNVTVLSGSWRDVLPREAPFDLLFVDADSAKDDVEAMVGLLVPGGTAMLDDVWRDPAAAAGGDRREAWLHHPRLATIELWVTPVRRALVSVRR